MSKLWKKDKDSLKSVERFTVGNDRTLDMQLAAFDVLGSLAHIRMLESIGLLTSEELRKLTVELKLIYERIQRDELKIEEDTEDIHSQIELELTRKLGNTGKKIHSGRSRNDQVLVDIKMYLRFEIEEVVTETKKLFDLLITKSEKHKTDLLPGYTHFQPAMPSSFGLWFSAYAESLVDDLVMLEAAYRVVNKNPLGSAAGYGSSFPLKRKMTTHLLGFDELNYNVVYAQLGRGKTERIVAAALAGIASTLGKLAADAIVFMNPNFGFISFPDELTTGSSIMPHKKNPDVFEIIRGRCNQLLALPNTITLVTANLPSGYHRDYQLLKEMLFPAIQHLKECLQMMHLMISDCAVKENILEDGRYIHLFSVEEVNKLVLQGVPFRDAYKKVGQDIEKGDYRPHRNLRHTHEGSIGNLCLPEIQRMMEDVLNRFNFAAVHRAYENLVG
ncbi:MAG: argininosuccinate lyase [Flammeovirgaceae bacterium]|nr:MAG: argininosuccinate lyase [Flammeovirgaceae bacterium]